MPTHRGSRIRAWGPMATALVLAFCPSCILASIPADLQRSFLSEISSSTVLSFARIFCQRQKHDGVVLLLACSTKSGRGHAAVAWNIRSMQWWTRTCVLEAWEGRHHISTSSCCGHRCCLFGLAETHEILGCANEILGRGQQPRNVRGLTEMTGGLPRRDLTCWDYSRMRVGAEVSRSFMAVTAVHRGEVSGWRPKLQFFWLLKTTPTSGLHCPANSVFSASAPSLGHNEPSYSLFHASMHGIFKFVCLIEYFGAHMPQCRGNWLSNGVPCIAGCVLIANHPMLSCKQHRAPDHML